MENPGFTEYIERKKKPFEELMIFDHILVGGIKKPR
jgi:hypothetical protein